MSKATDCVHSACTPENSRPLPGFSLSDCLPVGVDTYNGTLRWKGGDRVPATAAGTPLRVRFVLLRARLYSFDWRL